MKHCEAFCLSPDFPQCTTGTFWAVRAATGHKPSCLRRREREALVPPRLPAQCPLNITTTAPQLRPGSGPYIGHWPGLGPRVPGPLCPHSGHTDTRLWPAPPPASPSPRPQSPATAETSLLCSGDCGAGADGMQLPSIVMSIKWGETGHLPGIQTTTASPQ